MDRYRIREYVTDLVKHTPDQAVEILTRCCEEREKVLHEVFSSLIQSRPKYNEALAGPGNHVNINFPPRRPPSSHGSHHAETPPPRQGPPRRFLSTAFPMSPPATASSVTSHSTRDESSAGEYILLPTLVGTRVVDQKARMKFASIRHSVIRADVVGKRNLEDSFNLSQAELTHVNVPHRASGELQLVPVSCAIELTWRRPHSDSTHNTLFYLVPKETLDIDIVLGFEDSGENPEYTPTIIPQTHERKSPAFQGFKQELRPQAPTPPSASFHRSAMTYEGTSSVHHRDEQYHPHQLVEPLISRQQSYARAMEGQQSSPAPTVIDTHIEQPQPLRPNPPTSASAPATDPNKVTDRIRLSLVWDATTLNVWLDFNAYGEAFYEAFQQQASKQRKEILDRTNMTIQFKKDKNLPYEGACALSLDEDDLEADWETTCEWLNANRRDKSPHIYGVVETEEG